MYTAYDLAIDKLADICALAAQGGASLLQHRHGLSLPVHHTPRLLTRERGGERCLLWVLDRDTGTAERDPVLMCRWQAESPWAGGWPEPAPPDRPDGEIGDVELDVVCPDLDPQVRDAIAEWLDRVIEAHHNSTRLGYETAA